VEVELVVVVLFVVLDVVDVDDVVVVVVVLTHVGKIPSKPPSGWQVRFVATPSQPGPHRTSQVKPVPTPWQSFSKCGLGGGKLSTHGIGVHVGTSPNKNSAPSSCAVQAQLRGPPSVM